MIHHSTGLQNDGRVKLNGQYSSFEHGKESFAAGGHCKHPNNGEGKFRLYGTGQIRRFASSAEAGWSWGGVRRGPWKLSHMLSGFLPLADLG
jgi:hypothetical protein